MKSLIIFWQSLFFTLFMVQVGAATVVPLHPALPDTLKENQISSLNLFPDLTGVSTLWFEQAVWGGIVAHLQIKQGPLEKKLERAISRSRWLEMRGFGASLAAGLPPGPKNPSFVEDLLPLGEPSAMVKVWPEVAARNRDLPPELAADSGPQYPKVAGRWLVSGGLGYQHNVSSYSEFFTDMVVFQLNFAHAVTNYIMPYAGITAGFGDLDSDYENLFGDGHGSNYSAMAGLMVMAPVSRRGSIYLSGQGGYFRRSLQWGGIFEDPQSGDQVHGRARETGDWGFGVQVGFLRQKSHARKARFFDFGMGLMWGEVERWDDSAAGVHFIAEGDDAWLVFMFRFWDQI